MTGGRGERRGLVKDTRVIHLRREREAKKAGRRKYTNNEGRKRKPGKETKACARDDADRSQEKSERGQNRRGDAIKMPAVNCVSPPISLSLTHTHTHSFTLVPITVRAFIDM